MKNCHRQLQPAEVPILFREPSFDNVHKRISLTTKLRAPVRRSRMVIISLCYFGDTEFQALVLFLLPFVVFFSPLAIIKYAMYV
jgi:hypothetical protein